MSGINSDQQIDLLFKQFNVVANTEQAPTSFANQPFLFRDNILNQQILAQEVPSTLPSGFSINELDICGNIAIDSSLNLSVIGYPQLTFYKKLELQQAGNNSAWWHIDGAGKNLLQDTIPFKFDESSADSYNSQLFYELSPGSYAAIGRDEAGTKYLMDTKTGIIEFYEDPATLNTIINASFPPRLSFIAYTGTKGITGGGGGGGDASFNNLSVNNLDVSNNLIVRNTQFLQTIGPELLTINTIKFFRIAQINMSDQLPANSGPTVCSGRFMIKTQDVPSTCIEFIAGFYSDKFTLNDPSGSAPNYPSNIKPFIKVIHSNGQDIIQNGINFICIGIDGTSNPGDPAQSNIELIIGFKQGSQTVSNATVRLYDNNEGTGNNDSDYRDWTLDESFTQTTGPLNINSGYNIVKQVNIDTFNTNPTGNSVAISSLDSETFMGNVNVGEKLTVLNGIDISGDITIIDPTGILNINGGTVDLAGDLKIQQDTFIDGSLNVNGFTTLKDVFTQNITTKPFSTIDNSYGKVNTYELTTEFLYPANVFYPNTIRIHKADFKFDNAPGVGGHIIDVSAITSDGDNLLLNGGLEFNNASDISNTIVNLNSIYPSGIIGSKILNIYGDILNIYGDIDMSDNNITNIKTIIPGQNQNNLLTISGDLLVDGSLNILSIYPPSGSNNIDIFGNLLMNDFKISNVGELIMNGNIDLSGNNILKGDIIVTNTLRVQEVQGNTNIPLEIDSNNANLNILANNGNCNISQGMVTYNAVELDMSGDGILDITTKNGQSSAPGYATGGLEITTINNKDKAPHTFYNAIPSTLISELSNNDMPNGSIAVMKNIGIDVQGISGGLTPQQSQTISLPIIKLLNKFETNNYYKYMYLGNENTYTFFNRRPARDEAYQTRGSDTVGSPSPYQKDISSGFVPQNATRYVQGSGGISYFYFDVSNNSSSNNFVSTCKFEVLNPISHMNALGPGWTTTDYSGTGLSEYALLPGNTYPRNGIVAIPSRNNIGPYLNREGYITEISYYFPFWQQSEIIGIAGPIIFRNLGLGSPSGPDAPYISIYIDGNETKGKTIGGNPLGEIELKKYPATLGTTLIKGTGDTITLPPEKWIYVGKNANLSELIKMKIVIPKINATPTNYDGMSIGVCGGMIRTSCMLASTDAGQLNFQDSYDIGAIQGHLNIITLPSYVSS